MLWARRCPLVWLLWLCWMLWRVRYFRQRLWSERRCAAACSCCVVVSAYSVRRYDPSSTDYLTGLEALLDAVPRTVWLCSRMLWRCICLFRLLPFLSSVESLAPLGLVWIHTVSMSYANHSSGCRKDGLYNSTHLCIDSCLRQGLAQEELLAFTIASGTVINERDYSLPAIQKYHLAYGSIIPSCVSSRTCRALGSPGCAPCSTQDDRFGKVASLLPQTRDTLL